VRNWAKVQIVVLSPLRNIFFRLCANFPNVSFQRRAGAAEHERTLSFVAASGAAAAPAAQRFLALWVQARRVNGSMR
jgi:hypothetical protein